MKKKEKKLNKKNPNNTTIRHTYGNEYYSSTWRTEKKKKINLKNGIKKIPWFLICSKANLELYFYKL